ncbi:hypothetical protein ACTFIW_003842 [Dictyostelium discoideum]
MISVTDIIGFSSNTNSRSQRTHDDYDTENEQSEDESSNNVDVPTDYELSDTLIGRTGTCYTVLILKFYQHLTDILTTNPSEEYIQAVHDFINNSFEDIVDKHPDNPYQINNSRRVQDVQQRSKFKIQQMITRYIFEEIYFQDSKVNSRLYCIPLSLHLKFYYYEFNNVPNTPPLFVTGFFQ